MTIFMLKYRSRQFCIAAFDVALGLVLWGLTIAAVPALFVACFVWKWPVWIVVACPVLLFCLMSFDTGREVRGYLREKLGPARFVR